MSGKVQGDSRVFDVFSAVLNVMGGGDSGMFLPVQNI